MTVAIENPPVSVANADVCSRHQTLINPRQFRNASPVLVASRLEGRRVLAAETVRAKKLDKSCEVIAAVLSGHGVRSEEFGLRHDQWTIEAFGEPGGVPEVIRVIVRRDEPKRMATGERLGKMRRPQRARRNVTITTIDLGPAIAVREQPKIDVVEREWQGHAQPENPRRNFYRLAGTRGCGERKGQRAESRRVHVKARRACKARDLCNAASSSNGEQMSRRSHECARGIVVSDRKSVV